MSNFLERLNERRSGVLAESERNILEQTSVDVDFHEAYEKGDVVNVYFEMADAEGNLYANANGYTICLTFEVIEGKISGFETRMKNRLLRAPLAVKIRLIDEENKCIYVVLENAINVDGKTPEERAQNEKRFAGRLAYEIHKSLRMHKEDTTGTVERPKVVGTILSVGDKFAMVSIYGTVLIGRIFVQEWSPAYLRSLRSVCRRGDTFVFEVTDEKPRLDDNNKPRNNESMWELSRVNITPDPWDKESLKRITPGSVLRVSSINFPEGKPYFWGTSRMCPGIEIMCERRDDKLPMKQGLTYNCRVKRVDLGNKELVVTPFEISEESKQIASILKEASGVKKDS